MPNALDDTLADIARSFGAGSVMRLAEDPAQGVEVIPTGSVALDSALGIGGLPRGRIVEVIGPEASGKTTLVSHVVANAQAAGLTCCFLDIEHALDPSYAERIGVDVSSLLIVQPNYAEEALEIGVRLTRSGGIGVLVIDSLAMLAPRAELDGEMGEAQIGLKARMIGQALRKLTPAARQNGTLVLATNQIRERVGVMFGSPETTPGGRAMRYAATVRLDLRRVATEKRSSDDPHQIKVKAKVIKNKLAAPYRECEFNIRFGEGILDRGKRGKEV